MAADTNKYEGQCHCGAVGWTLATTLLPERWAVRHCGCRFCRHHGAASWSDRDGHLDFWCREAGTVQRYRFGLKTADFNICTRCGVYVGASMPSGAGAVGIVNVRASLDVFARAGRGECVDYSGEDGAGRTRRRGERWMPCVPIRERE